MAVATKYFYSILMPAHPLMGMRNSRETRTLCRALDLLAVKEYGQAADLIAQRVKALERNMVDNHWDRAQWAELLPPEGTTLMDREEDQMLAQEESLQNRLRGKGGGYGWQDWRSEKGSKGKGKGKDKGKDKGKYRARGKGDDD